MADATNVNDSMNGYKVLHNDSVQDVPSAGDVKPLEMNGSKEVPEEVQCINGWKDNRGISEKASPASGGGTSIPSVKEQEQCKSPTDPGQDVPLEKEKKCRSSIVSDCERKENSSAKVMKKTSLIVEQETGKDVRNFLLDGESHNGAVQENSVDSSPLESIHPSKSLTSSAGDVLHTLPMKGFSQLDTSRCNPDDQKSQSCEDSELQGSSVGASDDPLADSDPLADPLVTSAGASLGDSPDESDPLADPLASSAEASSGLSEKDTQSGSHGISDDPLDDTDPLADPLTSLTDGVQPAAVSHHRKDDKPQLVIVDTSSIISGKGPIPLTASKLNNAKKQSNTSRPPTSHKTVLEMMSRRGLTITDSKSAAESRSRSSSPSSTSSRGIRLSTPSSPPLPAIVHNMKDDTLMVEAPSLVVPYVIQSPPQSSIKSFSSSITKSDSKQEQDPLGEESEKCKSVKKQGDNVNAEDVSLERKTSEGGNANKCGTVQEATKASDTTMKNTNQLKSRDVEGNSKAKEESEKTGENDANVAKEAEDLAKKCISDEAKEAFPNKGKIEIPKSFTPFSTCLMNLGLDLIEGYLEESILSREIKKASKLGDKCPDAIRDSLNAFSDSVDSRKQKLGSFDSKLKKCPMCSYRTESGAVLARHLELPHRKKFTYFCNFCSFRTMNSIDLATHFGNSHNQRMRLEAPPDMYQCPFCPWEDNKHRKYVRHILSCEKKFKPNENLSLPLDWDPPCKQKVVTNRGFRGRTIPTIAAKAAQHRFHPLVTRDEAQFANSLILSALYKQPMQQSQKSSNLISSKAQVSSSQRIIALPERQTAISSQMMTKAPPERKLRPSVTVLPSFQKGSSRGQTSMPVTTTVSGKIMNSHLGLLSSTHPNITITPLPKPHHLPNPHPNVQQPQSSGTKLVSTPGLASRSTQRSGSSQQRLFAPLVQPSDKSSASKGLIICEICDGCLKSLEQLQNHMEWVHKIKIAMKMMHNRPPLNCQKCQFRFFTDQGLERHLLGSHGLVTSSMQEAAHKNKDGGRCPICGKVFKWKLVTHVSKDHKVSLKPAHLSYKCTVCSATFRRYKMFEHHVYERHGMGKNQGKKNVQQNPSGLLRPAGAEGRVTVRKFLPPSVSSGALKLSDEITIIPQPFPVGKSSGSSAKGTGDDVIELSSNEGEVSDSAEGKKCQPTVIDLATPVKKLRTKRSADSDEEWTPSRRKRRSGVDDSSLNRSTRSSRTKSYSTPTSTQ